MTTSAKKVGTFCPGNRQEWRAWLQKNHASKDAVWLIYYKKNSKKFSLTWDDAVEEALCFGWIDSKRQAIDQETFRQFFAKRKPGGTWSLINKGRVESLIKDGLMAPAGMEAIELAKRNGSWNKLNDVDALTVPPDLKSALRKVPGASSFFSGLSRSSKWMMLHWVAFAKRNETRQKRINEIASRAGKGLKPRRFM